MVNFPQLPRDKRLHLIGCAIISAAVTVLLLPIKEPLNAALWGFGVSMTVGILKELYDLISGKGTPEFGDLLADFASAIVGPVIALREIWK